MAPIRILIADDSAVARRQLTEMLAADPQLEVVASVHTGRMAIEKAEQLKPDVVMLDMAMPDMNGLEVLRVLRQRMPSMLLLMFSAMMERAGTLALDALALGADDCIPKPSTLHGASGLARARDPLIARIKALHARPPHAPGARATR